MCGVALIGANRYGSQQTFSEAEEVRMTKQLRKENFMATFYNKATLTYNNGSTDSNIVTGELAEVLSAAKTALESDYDVGCPIT